MIRLSFLPPELARWDGAEADALCVFVFEDQRPPRGAAGLADWRLCGRLSRWLVQGRLTGRRGERLLTPLQSRLPWARLLVLGAGAQAAFDEAAYRACVRDALRTLAGVGARRYVLALPGRAEGRIAPRRALEILREEGRPYDTEALVVEGAAAQKEMAEAVRRN
ncbi:MAG TPA: M17 family peptidase N-terminal domain-containing protein [Polyangia bacterium]|nr:M17 family peptidase N-terminal domain-containing protein [Polyangia bacterium]